MSTGRLSTSAESDTDPTDSKNPKTSSETETETPIPQNGSTPPTTEQPDSQISASQAITYWTSTPASVDGMLGGYPQVSRADLQSSSNFLSKLRLRSRTHPPGPKLKRVADCGAGIGRVTLGFLSNVAAVVDVVEPVAKFTERITEGEEFEEVRERGGVGRVWNVGLEDWDAEVKNRAEGYDLIWNQWCLGQLKDKDLVRYLGKSKGWLTQGGWIVVKENLSNDKQEVDIYDEVDSSVTRTDNKFRALFEEAGLKIVHTELQRGFPRSLYPVRMYALQPAK